jgi:hypothetical protein
MHPAEAHQIFEETLARSRTGAIDWRLKSSRDEPRCLDFAAAATDGAHGVEIGSEDVEEYGTVYEFRVMDTKGGPLYEYALSFHAKTEGDGRTYEEFVELFTLAKNHAGARSGKSR